MQPFNSSRPTGTRLRLQRATAGRTVATLEYVFEHKEAAMRERTLGASPAHPVPAARLSLAGDGRPRRLDWGDRSYLVTDLPTPLEDALGWCVTHPLPVSGWRFQGTALEDGDARVFDVLWCVDAWVVLQTYR
jgi:hypothetical protein